MKKRVGYDISLLLQLLKPNNKESAVETVQEKLSDLKLTMSRSFPELLSVAANLILNYPPAKQNK